MPRRLLMSPDFKGRHARWRKLYKGEPYSVTCADLGLPESEWTELGSYQAANAWWVKKRAEVDSAPPKLRPDVAAVLNSLRQKQAALQGEGADASEYEALAGEIAAPGRPLIDPELEFASLEDEIDAVVRAKAPEGDGVSVVDPMTATRVEFLTALGVDLSMLDATSLELALGTTHFWSDKLARTKPVAADRRIGTHLDSWLELKRASAEATSLVSLEGVKRLLGQFVHNGKTVLSSEMPVDVIDEAKVREVYLAIGAEWGIEGTGKKKWDSWSNFVRHLAENKIIPLPVNLDSKEFRFKVVIVQKPTPDMKKVSDFIGGLPDRFKLYALLAANCGMNNTDIAHLEFWTDSKKVPLAMLDLDKRIVRRKRVKTSTSPDVPTVTYWLWDETVRLLRQEMATTGPLVLTDARGGSLMITQKGSGSQNSSVYDKIKSSWRDHFKRKGGGKLYTVSDFRDISAALIQNEPQSRAYWDVFLGHSPKTVAGKSYATSEDVSHVCKWLMPTFFPTPTDAATATRSA